jgi:hypothetical protein
MTASAHTISLWGDVVLDFNHLTTLVAIVTLRNEPCFIMVTLLDGLLTTGPAAKPTANWIMMDCSMHKTIDETPGMDRHDKELGASGWLTYDTQSGRGEEMNREAYVSEKLRSTKQAKKMKEGAR